MIQTETLAEAGLRIVCDHRPGEVVHCGLAVDAGTRDELPEESGMAHFLEHMTFKGTRRRRAWHIINRMEAVGGELNAYTGKEHTVYYCTTLRQHLARALDLLFDITLCSTYPSRELEREVEVVVDEIESYNDSPSELIYDEFESHLFPDHPLGRNILGNADRLRSYRTDDLRRFADRLYRPSRMVLFVYGNVKMKQVVKWVERFMKNKLPDDVWARGKNTDCPLSRSVPPAPMADAPQVISVSRSTHQAHVLIGTRACAMNDDRRMALYLLNNILGGPGMNSRLNLSLRERRGLVYTVESSLTSYTDTGIWQTYFGCDHADVNRCRRLVAAELNRLTDSPLSASALSAAKRQLKGQLALSWENSENVAISMGRRMLHLGQTQTLTDLCRAVDELTSSQLLDVAQDIFAPSRLLTLMYV